MYCYLLIIVLIVILIVILIACPPSCLAVALAKVEALAKEDNPNAAFIRNQNIR